MAVWENTAESSVEQIVGEASSLISDGANPSDITIDGDVLTGSTYSDSMIASDQNDVLIGSIAKAQSQQRDLLTEGGGRDLFVLGNKDQSFYSSQGMGDYAQITDFDPTQDRLQLHSGSSYFTAQVDHPSLLGTGVFKDSDGNGLMSTNDELIAVLSHQNSSVELQRNNLQLV